MSNKGIINGNGATVDRAPHLAADRQRRVALLPAPPMLVEAGELGQEERPLGFRQLLCIVRRQRRTIERTAAIGALLLTTVAVSIPARYTAMAQIEVIAPGMGASDRASQLDLRASQMLIDNHIVMLRSRDFLLKLLPGVAGARSENAAGPAADGSSAREHRGIQKDLDAFESQLVVSQMLSSSVIAIRLTSRNPEWAAEKVNRLVSLYIDELRLARESHLKGELERLAQRASEVSRGLTSTPTSMEQAQTGAGAQERSPDAERDAGTQPDSRAGAQRLTDLMRRQSEIRTQLENVAPEVRVVSYASTPIQRSSLNPILFVVPGIVVILMAGAYVAIIRDQMDEGLRSARDVESAIAIPCAGLLAEVERSSGQAPHEHLLAAPFAPFTEGIRSVFAALGLADVASTQQTVLLTSSIEGEGRTTLTLSLARYAASAGLRVIVVDLDVRNPGLSRLLGLDCGPELANFFSGAGDPMTLVQRHPDWEFDVMPMTPAWTDPLQLLRSEGLHSALATIAANYDVVVIDGPSILGHPEAALLTGLADKVLFLVRWGTPRQIAQNAARQLQVAAAQARAMGGSVLSVVTRVHLAEHAEYGFDDFVLTHARKPASSKEAEARSKLEFRQRKQFGELERRPTAGRQG